MCAPLKCAAMLLAAMLLAGCKRAQSAGAAAPSTRPAVEVTLVPVSRQTIEKTVPVYGTLFGDEQATISAKIPGRIASILADVGDRVAVGQVLARIDEADDRLLLEQKELALHEALARLGATTLPSESFDPETVPSVSRAKDESDNARSKLERARTIRDENPQSMSEQDFGDITTAAEVARHTYEMAVVDARSLAAAARMRERELAAASQRLTDCAIRAPGRPLVTAATAPAVDRFAVTQRLVSEGEYVKEGDALFRLVADDPVKFRAPVIERYVGDVRPGQRVHVQVRGYAEPFEGTVRRVNPSIDPQSRAFEVEVVIPNANRRLRPGAFAEGHLVIGEQRDVPFVPRSAIVSFAGVDRVFTVADGKAVEHIVRLGDSRGDTVAVMEGLKDAAQVVGSGAQRLSDQSPVRPG